MSLLPWPGGDLYEELKRVGGRFRERDTAARVLGPCLQARLNAVSVYCKGAGSLPALRGLLHLSFLATGATQ